MRDWRAVSGVRPGHVSRGLLPRAALIAVAVALVLNVAGFAPYPGGPL